MQTKKSITKHLKKNKTDKKDKENNIEKQEN